YWHGRQFPACWCDTANDLEKKAFRAKDMRLGVYEFSPQAQQSANARAELYTKMERLIRAHAQESGRGRLSSNIREREVYYPRGALASSGEGIPEGHSLRARMWIVDVAEGDIDENKLAVLQAKAAQGLMAQAMAAYVQWMAGRFEELRRRFVERHGAWGEEAGGGPRGGAGHHARKMGGCGGFRRFSRAGA